MTTPFVFLKLIALARLCSVGNRGLLRNRFRLRLYLPLTSLRQLANLGTYRHLSPWAQGIGVSRCGALYSNFTWCWGKRRDVTDWALRDTLNRSGDGVSRSGGVGVLHRGRWNQRKSYFSSKQMHTQKIPSAGSELRNRTYLRFGASRVFWGWNLFELRLGFCLVIIPCLRFYLELSTCHVLIVTGLQRIGLCCHIMSGTINTEQRWACGVRL